MVDWKTHDLDYFVHSFQFTCRPEMGWTLPLPHVSGRVRFRVAEVGPGAMLPRDVC